MEDPNIFQLKDFKPTSDPIYNYTRQNKSAHTPIVIDNGKIAGHGSYQCRVGWANQAEPLMIFKNLVAKPRKERGKKDGDTQIGNDIINIEAVRFQLRTQFDRDVVTNLEVQEQILDHVFTHLGIDTEGCVEHPIVMTETFLNPNYSRGQMSELLFEAYEIPGVVYGVDALYSLQYSQPRCQDSLIVRLGHQCCHIMPVLNGKVKSGDTRRVNIGGFHITNYLHRLLQLRHSLLAPAISLSRVEELLHQHCRIALNFHSELSEWELPGYQDSHALWIQLPFTAAPAPTATAGLTPEQQQQRRRDLARRLGEMNARKRDERLAEDEEQLSKLMRVHEMLEDGDDEEYQRSLEQFDLSNSMELGKAIAQLQARIDKTRQKIAAAANASEEPSTSVASEQVELKTSKLLQEMALLKEPEELEAWIDGLKNKRQELLEKRAARRQRRQDMAKRRTAAAQERMRIISQLARKDKRDDNFGMRDEDWDVYKAINKDGGDTDSEEEGERLAELEEVLRRYAPDETTQAVAASSLTLTKPESYQLALCTEMTRAPELLFQPSMAGHDQGGIAETIDFILKRYTPEEQNRLANNVFVTGGVAQFSGLVERLKLELQQIRPFGSSFSIHLSPKPSLSAWLGAQKLAKDPQQMEQATFSRAEYLERGGDYLVEHVASNIYWPSQPLPEVLPGIPDLLQDFTFTTIPQMEFEVI